jgi:guanylate kinase
MSAPRRGLLVIISSPSGAGKTTLARRLRNEFPDVGFSVSYTTRPMRVGEQDGVDYFFVTAARFAKMIDAGEFAEWAEVHGNRYGTARAVVEQALADGKDVVFDVDWQGGDELSGRWPDDALMVCRPTWQPSSSACAAAPPTARTSSAAAWPPPSRSSATTATTPTASSTTTSTAPMRCCAPST